MKLSDQPRMDRTHNWYHFTLPAESLEAGANRFIQAGMLTVDEHGDFTLSKSATKAVLDALRAGNTSAAETADILGKKLPARPKKPYEWTLSSDDYLAALERHVDDFNDHLGSLPHAKIIVDEEGIPRVQAGETP